MIPQTIIEAVNAILLPYGEKYEPKQNHCAERHYVLLPEAAKMCGLSVVTLRRRCKEGRIAFKHSAGRTGKCMVDLASLREWLAEK